MNERRCVLGIDYGSVRIGLAVSDTDRRFSFPLSIYERIDAAKDAEFFRGVVEKEGVGLFLLGLPLHLNGNEGAKATEVRAFAAWLEKELQTRIVFWDERFTTVEAESALWDAGLTDKKRKARRDAVAAQILLQSWLDAGRPEQTLLGSLDDPTG